MTAVQKVLVLGSGALKIGQAGEFDYSGSQALKALKEEGIQTVLVNPNIATIQTSQQLADTIYFLPVTPFFVTKIIEKERPDGILLSFGGQTALNCGIELFEQGVLEQYNVRILGTPISAIILTEDRQKFAEHLHGIDIPTPQSRSATTLQQALTIGEEIGYPLMLRAGFALGGQGSGIAHNVEELERIVNGALAFAPQVLVEQYLHHYKEVEYEVVRDRYDNCITVCNMENMDPLGIHTGESIVVAPSQTLTNNEYHTLRNASINIVRSLGIVGECNVQFALDPLTSAYYVIEVNARLSRSSALASKATGYPLAYVAAKLGLGYGLTELTNKVTGVTSACFEPSLDYLVVKIPRWNLEKFKGVDTTIGTAMKSVGEVMGIGRTFEEALQKAIRMLNLNLEGVTDAETLFATSAEVHSHLERPTPERVFAVARALQEEVPLHAIANVTGIDAWFLQRVKHIVDRENELREYPLLNGATLLGLKQIGCSDKRIGELIGSSEMEIREMRRQFGIAPSIFQIDTLAAEFPSATNYLYLTYNGQHHDIEPFEQDGVIVLGSGPYHIGSSVEFDWTSVSTAEALKKHQKRSVVINCNPETVSTDSDVSDRLYFEELSFERIADIYEFEQPYGVIVSVGGQVPNNRAKALQHYGCTLLGTNAVHIDQAEDRGKFSHLLDSLGIEQPAWNAFSTLDDMIAFAERVGYPVLIRPSYVLSGSAMNVCYSRSELVYYARRATAVSREHPVTVSKFYERAREIEFDAVAQHGQVKAFVISEHIENAGVHSGDATIVLPPQDVTAEVQRAIEQDGRAIAQALTITGPFNIQFLIPSPDEAQGQQIAVIEANLRASRTFPFISKVTGVNFMELFVDALFHEIPEITIPAPTFTAVKAPQFSFARLSGADPIQRVEMASTGEVATFGEDVEEAYLKAMLATGGSIPTRGIFVSVSGDDKQEAFLDCVRDLQELHLPLYAPEETWTLLHAHNIEAIKLHGPDKQDEPNVRACFREGLVDLAIVVVAGKMQKELDENYVMRRLAVDSNTPLLTKIKQVRLFARALREKDLETIPIKSWNEYL
ncbi:MAG TPA: carbamoyl-phosphate synthase (glutamine-hydrolyzing) large subunit [Ktedonobacteraceae bacterium]|nr:carbamoyl-phosphate synthase (glutamine-hydrolyzing) large subunit [Ktedonobacteraceae bacterium]